LQTLSANSLTNIDAKEAAAAKATLDSACERFQKNSSSGREAAEKRQKSGEEREIGEQKATFETQEREELANETMNLTNSSCCHGQKRAGCVASSSVRLWRICRRVSERTKIVSPEVAA